MKIIVPFQYYSFINIYEMKLVILQDFIINHIVY